jgi:hypothetical protein
MKIGFIKMSAVAIVVAVLCCASVCADDAEVAQAEQQAASIHATVMSNVIYTEQELKALYYQNMAILSYLRDIKGLLQKIADSQAQGNQ